MNAMNRALSFVLLLVSLKSISCEFDEMFKGMDNEMKEKFLKNRDECLASNSLTIADLKMRPFSETTEPQKCYFKCLNEKAGAINENGVPNPEKFGHPGSHMTEERIRKLRECIGKIDKIGTCEDMSKINDCHMASKE